MRSIAGALIERWRAGGQRAAAKRFYAGFVRAGDLVFDVGANVGDRTAVFRALGARVVAVEPQGSCLERLRATFSRDPEVRIVAAGLAAARGTMELSICDTAPTISTMSAEWRERGRFSGDFQWTHTETVPVSTLDALIEEHGVPAFCKIDVEGFERGVLEGLSRPIPRLSFEFTREFIDDAVACVRRLESLGGFGFNASLGESQRFLLPENISGDALLKALNDQTDPQLWGDVHAIQRAASAR
jgi:FkbM family methyltransferase